MFEIKDKQRQVIEEYLVSENKAEVARRTGVSLATIKIWFNNELFLKELERMKLLKKAHSVMTDEEWEKAYKAGRDMILRMLLKQEPPNPTLFKTAQYACERQLVMANVKGVNKKCLEEGKDLSLLVGAEEMPEPDMNKVAEDLLEIPAFRNYLVRLQKGKIYGMANYKRAGDGGTAAASGGEEKQTAEVAPSL